MRTEIIRQIRYRQRCQGLIDAVDSRALLRLYRSGAENDAKNGRDQCIRVCK